MILASFIQKQREFARILRSMIFSKFLLKSDGYVKYYSVPILGNPKNISIGGNSRIFYNVILKANKESDSLIIGHNCDIHSFTEIRASKGYIKIGDNCSLNNYGMIVSTGPIIIGNSVRIGPHSLIISSNHIYENPELTVLEQGTRGTGIVIEDDVWIGGGVKVLDGVKIGKGSIIAASAVVTRDIPEYSVAAGIPAKVIKKREL
ncbi:MAG: acyltransferase [bacterium]